MANTFKNAYLDLTTTLTDVYTCPASTTAIVMLIQVANVDGTNNVDVDVQWTDASAAAKANHLAKTLTVPADAAVNILGGRLVLETGDKIRAKASVVSDAELSVSVLEIT